MICKFLIPFSLSFSLLMLSCVSTSKYNELEQDLVATTQSMEQEIKDLQKKVITTEEKLVSQRDMLINLNSKLNLVTLEILDREKTIESLEKQIIESSQEAQMAQSDLHKQLIAKNQVLEQKERVLNTLVEKVSYSERVIENIFEELQFALRGFSENEFELERKEGSVSLVLTSQYLLEKPEELTAEASQLLSSVAPVMKKTPSLQLKIVGHTDRNEVRHPWLQDAWDLSSIRAATVGRFLVEEEDVNSSQVTVTGMAATSPAVSNETQAGRDLNNRVELIFYLKNDLYNSLLHGAQ